MFIIGLILLMLGSIIVYGSKYIRLLKDMEEDRTLIIKCIGFIMAVLGIFLIFYGEFPREVDFIRIF